MRETKAENRKVEKKEKEKTLARPPRVGISYRVASSLVACRLCKEKDARNRY